MAAREPRRDQRPTARRRQASGGQDRDDKEGQEIARVPPAGLVGGGRWRIDDEVVVEEEEAVHVIYERRIGIWSKRN